MIVHLNDTDIITTLSFTVRVFMILMVIVTVPDCVIIIIILIGIMAIITGDGLRSLLENHLQHLHRLV